MKSLLFVSCLLTATVSQAINHYDCPDLAGTYQCTVDDGTTLDLTVKQVKGRINGDDNDVKYAFISSNPKVPLTMFVDYWADGIGYAGPKFRMGSGCIELKTSLGSIPALISQQEQTEPPHLIHQEAFASANGVMEYVRSQMTEDEQSSVLRTATCTKK